MGLRAGPHWAYIADFPIPSPQLGVELLGWAKAWSIFASVNDNDYGITKQPPSRPHLLVRPVKCQLRYLGSIMP
ncbi:hypothetical protein FRX31_015180 [Thalictrum thalictroides]|uniref:Uncharacterized protein n=1 Tax=Thalictrum thalictroides TaxID=46969 RepID=A0A7J6WGJ5_THATH|nr:hypothetical protein FRX31_015180 [Thalictrum thalictroides]